MFAERRWRWHGPALAALSLAAIGGAVAWREPSCGDARGDRAVAASCGREFDRTGEPEAGLRAAQAELARGQKERARALAARLVSGPRASAGRRLLAELERERAGFVRARPGFEEALAWAEARGQESDAYAAAAALVTGLWSESDFDAALTFAEKAHAHALASGQPELVVKSLIALGSVYHGAGDRERALEAYEQASAALGPSQREQRADVLLRRGALLLGERQFALAEPLLEEGRALSAAIGATQDVAAAETNLADLALARRELAAASRHLARAAEAWHASGAGPVPPGILLNQAILARLRGDAGAAFATLGSVVAAAPEPEVMWLVEQELGQLAEAGGQLAEAERHYQRAIEIVEQMWSEIGPGALRAPFFEDRWQPYGSLFALRVRSGDAKAAFAAAVAAQGRMFLAESLEVASRQVRGDTLRSFGRLAATSSLAASRGASQIPEALRNHTVLNYFSDGERLHLLVIEGGRVRLTTVAVPLAELERLVDAFSSEPQAEAAGALGRLLVPAEVLPGAPRLYVVPAGPILHVPFAALMVEGQRLVHRYEVVYAPSAAALAVALANPRREATTSSVVLGDAGGELVHATAEGALVAQLTGARALLGAAASTQALRAAGEAELLHVAGHSGIGVDGGYLVLADAKVSAADLLKWRIRPRVVVLASCASAATNRRDMWGSLAVAFLAAGSEHVVATLHSVEDEVAAEFAAAFHRAGGARDPAAAVATAQRELARHRTVAQWSAFVAIGR